MDLETLMKLVAEDYMQILKLFNRVVKLFVFRLHGLDEAAKTD